MPAKFKPSERVYAKNSRGARMSTQPRSKNFKHYYLKNTSQQELLDAINSSRTKPKHKAKYRNELIRRGVKLVYQMEDGTQIPRTRQALLDYARENGGKFQW